MKGLSRLPVKSFFFCYRKALNIRPDNFFPHIFLAIAYASLDKAEEAHNEAETIISINPKFSSEYFSKVFAYKNQADRNRMVDALRKAGLK